MSHSRGGAVAFTCAFSIAVGAATCAAASGECDLSGVEITFQQKCKNNPCQVSSLTFTALNAGAGDAAGCSVKFYLSNDSILDLPSGPGDPDADVLIKSLSFGKIKSDGNKKRTLGGGLLKQANAVAGEYIIAVLTTSGECAESNTVNNSFSALIPFPPQ